MPFKATPGTDNHFVSNDRALQIAFDLYFGAVANFTDNVGALTDDDKTLAVFAFEKRSGLSRRFN